MGIVRADIEMKNPRLPDSPPVAVNMLVESGSHYLCIPESLRAALGLEGESKKSVVLADGGRREAPYVGPVELRFGGRVGYVGALVMGDEPALGVIPMEDMDLVILPKEERLAANPQIRGRGGANGGF